MHIVGRILLALLFFTKVVPKLADPGVFMHLLAGVGLPAWLVWPAAAFNASTVLARLSG